jgi:hypothetical protein
MKTNELIRQLQHVDPTGDKEVCIDGSADIFAIYESEAYWDGRLNVLVRDESKKPFYDVVGVKIIHSGTKIVLQSIGAEDVIGENWNVRVEVIGNNNVWAKDDVRCMRKEGYKIGLEYYNYPCETCKHKPVDFYLLYEGCYDCQPVNEFKEYLKLEDSNGQNPMS